MLLNFSACYLLSVDDEKASANNLAMYIEFKSRDKWYLFRLIDPHKKWHMHISLVLLFTRLKQRLRSISVFQTIYKVSKGTLTNDSRSSVLTWLEDMQFWYRHYKTLILLCHVTRNQYVAMPLFLEICIIPIHWQGFDCVYCLKTQTPIKTWQLSLASTLIKAFELRQ